MTDNLFFNLQEKNSTTYFKAKTKMIVIFVKNPDSDRNAKDTFKYTGIICKSNAIRCICTGFIRREREPQDAYNNRTG